MKNNLKIFVHGLPENEVKQVDISPDVTIKMLLHEILKIELLDFLVFMEDMEEVLVFETQLSALGKGHETHLHIHKQKTIDVMIEHDKHVLEHSFPPSTRIVNILKWCFHEFQITGQDRQQMILSTEHDGSALDGNMHLGSLVSHEHKSIRFYLIHKQHIIHYQVDDEPQTTTEWELTAHQILSLAHIDTSTHYLVQLQGHHQVSYQNNPEEQIRMHENMKFISVFTGETTVS